MINARAALVALAFAVSLPLLADSHPLLTATASGAAVRYAGWGEVREMRLEIFNDDGQPVFDSAFRRGNLLDYALTDRGGKRLGDGSYLFVVTIRDLDDGQSQKFGTLHIADRRVILQNGPAESLAPAHAQALNVAGRAPSITPVDRIGIDMPAEPAPRAVISPASPTERPGQSIMAVPRADISGSGTPNRITKWVDAAGTVGDSAITEVGGRLGIGTETPGALLHVFGPATADVFSGLGPNVVTGPAMNYGYAGNSFGRGAGFFNVRPDSSAAAPNPSLRFMTVNQQRMIITNTGNIGIGLLTPAQKLDVFGSVKLSGGGTLIFDDSTSMATAGATLGPNNFTGDQIVTGNIAATGLVAGNNGSFFGTVSAGTLSSTGAVNAETQYNIGGASIMKANGTSFSAGLGAGPVTDAFNTFVGSAAGGSSTNQLGNSFFGFQAGLNNGGDNNSFFGMNAGPNATGNANAFFGGATGLATSGSWNSFFGHGAGNQTTGGSDNTFVGASAGDNNTIGTQMTLLGAFADSPSELINSTAVGANAYVSQSNSMVLGSVAGVNGATVSTNVGIGTATPTTTLEIAGGRQYISTAGEGIILKSPDGALCRLITIANTTGALTASPVSCP